MLSQIKKTYQKFGIYHWHFKMQKSRHCEPAFVAGVAIQFLKTRLPRPNAARARNDKALSLLINKQ